jgi:nucleoid DNA-binding protein
LVSALAETTGLTKDKAREVLDAHAELLISSLKQTVRSSLPASVN